MDLNHITDKDIFAGILSGMGGMLRILLNVDPDIPRWKQFVILFFAAMPCGWFTYTVAIHYKFDVFAFPAGFFMGIMALSVVSIVARDGAAELLRLVIKRGDRNA